MVDSKELQEVETAPVAKQEGGRAGVESTRGETYVSPLVDIYETDGELVLVADVPGVSKDGVDLKLEDGVLEVTAHRTRASAGGDPVYAEYRDSSYYRAFSLSDELDTEKIDASLQDGVLTVSLPKSPKVQPRKIEVKTR
jgi:HSP20 family protein